MSTTNLTEVPLTISLGASSQTKEWVPTETSIGDFVYLLYDHKISHEKDGAAFVPGKFKDNKRKKNNAEFLSALVFDVDGGMSQEDVLAAAANTNRLAIVYTTYSNGQKETLLSLQQYVTWCKQHRVDPDESITDEQMAVYLKFLKKDSLENVHVEDDRDNSRGVYYIRISHTPVAKFRVVFPLEQPFYFMQVSVDPDVSARVWAETYATIGKELGLNYDTACTDPSRLYYLPSHPEHAKESDFGTWVFGGPLLDYRDYEVDDEEVKNVTSTAHKIAQRKTKRNFADVIMAEDREDKIVNLSKWLKENKKKLRIQELILDHAIGYLVNDKSDKIEITCPFEEHHSHPGGNAAIASNPQGKIPFGVNCLHESCQHRAPISFLQKMISDDWFTISEMIKYTLGSAKSKFVSSMAGGDDDGSSATDEYDKDDIGAGTTISIDERHALNNTKVKKIKQTREEVSSGDDLAPLVSEFKYGFELKRFVDAHPHYITDVDTEIMLYALSQIPGSTNFTRAYVLSRTSLDISPDEFAKAVYETRLVCVPFKEVITTLVKSQMDNTEITLEKQRIKEYYNMSDDDFARIYMNIYQSINGDTVPEEFMERVTEFDKNYAKIYRGTSTHILDKRLSLKNVKVMARDVSAFRTEFSNQKFKFIDQQSGEFTEENIFDYWFNEYPRHDTYEATTFDPTDKKVTRQFNLWGGWKFEAVEGDWQMIYDHILYDWCRGSQELFNWTMTYMADIFQNPGQRPSTSIAVIGGFGTGKSMLFEHGIGRMADPYYHEIVKADQLLGRFSGDTIKTKMVCLAEEAIFKGAAKIMDEIKQLISGKRISVEPKYGDVAMEPIHTRFFFVSNHLHALGLDAHDRRFVVLHSEGLHQQDHKYFGEMKDKLLGRNGQQDMTKAWYHALQNWKPESVGMVFEDLYKPPRTDLKVFQITASRDTPDRFFYDLLINGELTVVADDILVENIEWDMDAAELYIPLKKFRDVYRNFVVFLDKSKYKFEVNSHVSGYEKFFDAKYNDNVVQKRINQKNTKCIRFPNRKAECIRHFKEGRITEQEYGLATKIDGDVIE